MRTTRVTRARRSTPGSSPTPALEKSGQSYWADRSEEQILAVSAWVALAEGTREQAADYFEKLVALTAHADTPRPELAHAKAFLRQR